MTKIKCIVADDEPLAQKGLIEYINAIEYLELVAVCSNAAQAYQFISKASLIFLDIEMPDLSGIDFLKSLSFTPAVIFTTAYPQYALQGYELNVIDYLVKPIAFERFTKAVNKAKDFIQSKTESAVNNAGENDHLFIKADYKIEKIFFKEILFIEALQNYIAIHLSDKKLVCYCTMAAIEKQLPATLFMRIHKSYIAALSKIETLVGNKVIIQNHQLPVSRNTREKLLQFLGNKMVKR